MLGISPSFVLSEAKDIMDSLWLGLACDLEFVLLAFLRAEDGGANSVLLSPLNRTLPADLVPSMIDMGLVDVGDIFRFAFC